MKKKAINNCPVPQGTLLIIGGHENKGESLQKPVQQEHPEPLQILKSFVQLTHKKKPVIEVITTASNEPKESFNDYKKAFELLNVATVNHIHHAKREEIVHNNLEERINAADAIFFTGGDQLKLTSIYGGTQFLYQIKQKYIYDEIVLAGTSAGAMALSTPMIYAGNKEKQQLTGKINITVGLEFLKDVCIDTHFVERERFLRLAQVLASNPTSIGIGIEEDTALVINEGRNASIIGSGVVIIMEGFYIQRSNIVDFDSGKAFSIRNLNVHILSAGDEYEIPQCSPPHI